MEVRTVYSRRPHFQQSMKTEHAHSCVRETGLENQSVSTTNLVGYAAANLVGGLLPLIFLSPWKSSASREPRLWHIGSNLEIILSTKVRKKQPGILQKATSENARRPVWFPLSVEPQNNFFAYSKFRATLYSRINSTTRKNSWKNLNFSRIFYSNFIIPL